MLPSIKHSEPLQAAMRAGVAITVALLTAAWLKTPFGFWLVLTTVVVLQPTFGATLHRSKLRAIGTILGVAIGALLAAILNQALIPSLIIMLALVLLCVINIPISHAVAIFFATTLVMLLLAFHQPNQWGFVSLRVYDTLIGAFIGIICSLVLWPSWAKSQLNYNLTATMAKASHLLDVVLDGVIERDAKLDIVNPLKLELENTIDKNRQFLRQATQELSLSHHQLAPALALVESLEKLFVVLQTFHFISTSDFQPINKQRFHGILLDLKANTLEVLHYAESIIREPNQYFDREKRNQLFERIQISQELPIDRTPALRFLHRNMNLLVIETNHVLHAALLMAKPKMENGDHQRNGDS